MPTIGEFILEQSALGPGNTIGDMLLNPKATIDSNEIVQGTITSAGNIDAGSIASAGGIDFFAGCPVEEQGGLTIPVRTLAGYVPVAQTLPDFSNKTDRIVNALGPKHWFRPSPKDLLRVMNYGSISTSFYQWHDQGSNPMGNMRRNTIANYPSFYRADASSGLTLGHRGYVLNAGGFEANAISGDELTITFNTRREFEAFSSRNVWIVAWVTGSSLTNSNVEWGLQSFALNDFRFYARDNSGTLQSTSPIYCEPEASRLGAGSGIEVNLPIVVTVNFTTRRVRIFYDNGREGMLGTYEETPTPIFLPNSDYSNIIAGTSTGYFAINADNNNLDADQSGGYWGEPTEIALFDSIPLDPSALEQSLVTGLADVSDFDDSWIVSGPIVDVPENHERVLDSLNPYVRFSYNYANDNATWDTVADTEGGMAYFDPDGILRYRKSVIYESEFDSEALDYMLVNFRPLRGDLIGVGFDLVTGFTGRIQSGVGGINGAPQWSMHMGYYEKDYDPTCHFFYFGYRNGSSWNIGAPNDRGILVYRKDGAMYCQFADWENEQYYFVPFVGLEDETTALASGWKTGEIVYLTVRFDITGGETRLYCNDVVVGTIDMNTSLPAGFSFPTASSFNYCAAGDSTELNGQDIFSTRSYVGTPERRAQDLVLFDRFVTDAEIVQLAESFHKTTDDLTNNVSYQPTVDEDLLGTILCGGTIDAAITPTDGTIEVGTIAPAGTIDPV